MSLWGRAVEDSLIGLLLTRAPRGIMEDGFTRPSTVSLILIHPVCISRAILYIIFANPPSLIFSYINTFHQAMIHIHQTLY